MSGLWSPEADADWVDVRGPTPGRPAVDLVGCALRRCTDPHGRAP